ncbi:MAG TPA: hypothetical protein VEI97_17780, partial [bacterium]|nr:hypothetical protein [bacterium]
LLLGFTAPAQSTLVRRFFEPTFGTTTRILPSSDNGWIVFSPDSLKVAKFSSCGRNEWNRHYHFPDVSYVPGLNDIITTAGGGYAFMTRVTVGTAIGITDATLIVNLDAAGNVLWSKIHHEASYDQYPYTLRQDPQGNFVLFGNKSNIGGNTLNFISKISPAGTLLWSRHYSLGVIWGGALLTSDGGILARTGSRFIKTDASGIVQWTSKVNSPDDHHYLEPVEVADGYVFTSAGANMRAINFFKIDRQGRLLWPHRKRTSFTGQPPHLRLKPNGNLVAIFNKDIHGITYPTIVEFDPDINLVRQRTLVLPQPGIPLTATDLALAPNGSTLLTARVERALNGDFIFARTDSTFRFDCDTLLPGMSVTLEPVTQEFINVSSSPTSFTIIPATPTTRSFTLRPTTICAQLPSLELGSDTLLCPGTPLTLRNRLPGTFDRYLWSTGATSPSLRVTRSGTYWL